MFTPRIRTASIAVALTGATIVGAAGVAGAASSSDEPTLESPAGIVAQVDDENRPELNIEERREARQERREARQADRAEVAELLGLDLDSLKEQIQNGATLADVAAAQGVETSAVVDLIVEQKTERVQAGVDNGRITQERADEILAELPEKVTTAVEEGRPERDRGDRGNRGPRGGGDATNEG